MGSGTLEGNQAEKNISAFVTALHNLALLHFTRQLLRVGAVSVRRLCLQVGFSWAIAGSRVVDNKHHPADVVGGFFLGASVALIFVIRATACLKCALYLHGPTSPCSHCDKFCKQPIARVFK